MQTASAQHGADDLFGLCRMLCLADGYEPAQLPELAPLAQDNATILAFADGYCFKALIIVDARSGKPGFMADPQAARACAKALEPRCASSAYGKLPARIDIVEITDGNPGGFPERLEACGSGPSKTKSRVCAWRADPAGKKIHAGPGFLAGMPLRKRLQKWFADPRGSRLDIPSPPELPAAIELPGLLAYPLTCALLAANALLFAAMSFFPGPGEPFGIASLIAYGGSSLALDAVAGEWSRLFQASFLHAGFMHWMFNSIALYYAGRAMETVLPKSAMFALYCASAFGGSLLGLALNPPYLVSVGASSAIMGLLAANLLLAKRFPPGPLRSELQISSSQMLIPSLIPLASGVDYAGHAGGAAAGAACALLLLALWKNPAFGRASMAGFKIAAAACALALALCAAGGASRFPAYAKALRLAPQPELAQALAEGAQSDKAAAELALLYPDDPRLLFRLAAIAADSGDAEKALDLLHKARSNRLALQSLLPDAEYGIAAAQSAILFDLGRQKEALEAARLPCRSGPEKIRQMLAAQKLCPAG